jgi:Homeodomain-like domain
VRAAIEGQSYERASQALGVSLRTVWRWAHELGERRACARGELPRDHAFTTEERPAAPIPLAAERVAELAGLTVAEQRVTLDAWASADAAKNRL